MGAKADLFAYQTVVWNVMSCQYGRLRFTIFHFMCYAQLGCCFECNQFAYVTPMLRNQSHCQCAFTSVFDWIETVDCACYNLPDTQQNMSKYRVQLDSYTFNDNPGLQCLPLLDLKLSIMNEFNKDKMNLQVGYKIEENTTFGIMEVPLQYQNFGVLQNQIFFAIDNFLPLIKNNNTLWEPDMPENFKLTSLKVIEDYQDSLKHWSGRKSTADVMKLWSEDRLKDLNDLEISNVYLDYFRADDIACMPNLTQLKITEGSLIFFSGFSVFNLFLNTMAIYNDTMKEAYAEYGINQIELRRKLDEIGLQLYTTQHDIWHWKCPPTLISPLKNIDLSCNNLTENSIFLNTSVFQNLTDISLENNDLRNVTKILYSKLNSTSNLTTLKLAHNKIDNLYNLEQLGYVENLDLSYNLITLWQNETTFYSNFGTVNLSYNSITVMREEMLKSLLNLNFVDLGGNPIDCNNPQLELFQDWLKNYSYKILNLGRKYEYEPLTCNGTDIRDLVFDKKRENMKYYIIGSSLILLLMLSLPVILSIKYRFQLVYIWHLLQIRRYARNTTLEQKSRDWKYDAFVSYNFTDRQWVHDQLVNNLENDEEKYALCLHERDFQLGRYIMQNVAECMESSRHVIVVLSPNFVQSNWCQWELKLVQQLMFENTSDFLILVELERLDRKTLPSTLRLLMSTKTYLEWPSEGNLDHFWRRLKNTLGPPLAITLPKSCDDGSSEACGDSQENLIA